MIINKKIILSLALVISVGVATFFFLKYTQPKQYKLVEIEGIPTAKHSENKMNYPGRKQIFRSAKGDRLALFDERALPGEYPLLELVMKNGERLSRENSLEQIKDKTAQSVKQLSLETRRISQPIPISLEISVALEKLKNQVLNEKCSI